MRKGNEWQCILYGQETNSKARQGIVSTEIEVLEIVDAVAEVAVSSLDSM